MARYIHAHCQTPFAAAHMEACTHDDQHWIRACMTVLTPCRSHSLPQWKDMHAFQKNIHIKECEWFGSGLVASDDSRKMVKVT
jgi:hypothetical protein